MFGPLTFLAGVMMLCAGGTLSQSNFIFHKHEIQEISINKLIILKAIYLVSDKLRRSVNIVYYIDC